MTVGIYSVLTQILLKFKRTIVHTIIKTKFKNQLITIKLDIS